VSFVYLVAVCFVTAFTMSIVHDRVPDPGTYPPLPDIFLNNIAHISWAFGVAEYLIIVLAVMFVIVVLLHKHRAIMLIRFNAIAGTVFLLRCVTMYVTALSVPGVHLKCNVRVGSTLEEKMYHSWKIMMNFGLSMSGVRTCGDYMFSGHTIVLTLLNFFILNYTPADWRGLQYITWFLNITGMFLILAGHEHYSIDVLIAFYISSRLFLYYHSLANSRVMVSFSEPFASQRKEISVISMDHQRIHGSFPMFSYLEEHINGIIENEYEWPWDPIVSMMQSCSKNKSFNITTDVPQTKTLIPLKKRRIKKSGGFSNVGIFENSNS